MRNVLSTLACAVALCAATAAQAALVSFNNPTRVDVNSATDVASYNEAGLTFSGDAASFLPLDLIGSGGSGGLFGLAASTFKLTAGFVHDNVRALPEPASLALVAVGIACVAALQRKRVMAH